MNNPLVAKLLISSGTVLFSLVNVVTAAPLTITTATDLSGADSRIRLALPDTNFGSSEFVSIQNDTTTSRKTYLRFDTSSLVLPAASATLFLTPTNDFGSATFNLYGLNDLNAGESWGEGTLTWNNAPANLSSPGDVDITQATLLGTFAFPGFTEDVPISFSSLAIRDFVNADTNNLLTFIITRPVAGPTNFTFASKENTDGYAYPTLRVTPVPEPSTFTLLGMGAIGLIGFCRRNRKQSA